MKYIITESKLDQVIYDYLDELFAAENGNTEIYTLQTIDVDNEDVEGSYDFVNDDYYEGDNQEYLFSLTTAEYYKTIHPKYITKHELETLSNDAPIVGIYDKDKLNQLNSYFGDMWKPKFKQWFKDKTGMDFKSLDVD